MEELVRYNSVASHSLSRVDNKLTHKGLVVATTALVAEKLGATPDQITDNFNGNKARYQEGIHYFLLKGDDLKQFNLQAENFRVQISSMTRQLYLWTEKGAFNHVKSLGTDEAWDAYQVLVDTYFRAKEIASRIQMPNFNNPAEAARAWANEYEQRQLSERKVENLQIGLDNMLSWVSILKVAIHNHVKETNFKWSVLKKQSIAMGYEVKQTESGRFKYQNLYHVDVFRVCYPQYNYDFKIREY